MEFDFDLKELLPEEINRVDRTQLINNQSVRSRGSPFSSAWKKEIIDKMLEIIDKMGLASAKAQGLNHTITTGEKLKESDHILYIIADKSGNRGKGSVLGILKMGYKKLFLLDQHGNQHEMTPPCVLDFYVHESCQRKGLGKKLFEFMLKDLNIQARQLAIDRPSEKFLSFLESRYTLSNPVHQVNRFTVFAGIFPERKNNDDYSLPDVDHGRRSDPISICDRFKSKVNHRQSYPPTRNLTKLENAGFNNGSSTVASVVFGQLHSKLGNEDYIPRHTGFTTQCQSTTECRNNFGVLRHKIDSSFNIFGVPSPTYTATSGHQG